MKHRYKAVDIATDVIYSFEHIIRVRGRLQPFMSNPQFAPEHKLYWLRVQGRDSTIVKLKRITTNGKV